MITSIIKEQIFEIIRQRYFPHEYKLVASNVDEILKLFEKLIDDSQNIKNLKPATKPEDVIYNCGIYDGLQKLKEELRK